MSEQPCQHEWACPGALQIAAEGKLVIILPLFCRLCAAVQTKVAPPVEQSPIQRAQLMPAVPSMAGMRDR
jgi:hypothetical protein